MKQREQGVYIGYDYMELAAERDEISFLLDGYENFGWSIDQNVYYNDIPVRGHNNLPHQTSVMLQLKRERKIANKTELTRLQRHFEACVRELKLLEQRKTTKATMFALIIGILGAAFMAGAVFAITATPPHILLCIVLAIPAFIGWLLPFFVYRRIVMQETERIDVLIEQKYDEMHRICERGKALLYEK